MALSGAAGACATCETPLPFFEKYSLPGMCLALQRLKLKRKQGRVHVHSPDPFYLVKMRWIEQARQLANGTHSR